MTLEWRTWGALSAARLFFLWFEAVEADDFLMNESMCFCFLVDISLTLCTCSYDLF